MCRAGVDQTMRMTQRWYILAPRVQQIHRVAPKNEHWTSSPKEALFKDRNDWDSWSKLARTPDHSAREPQPRTRLRLGESKKLSTLESMPAEIITMIVGDLALDETDLIRLGLASSILWVHVMQHVKRSATKSTARWAGLEIACIGTYVTDLPASFEKNNLAKSTVQVTEWGQTCMARKINYSAMSSYTSAPSSPGHSWIKALDACLKPTSPRMKETYDHARQEISMVTTQIPKPFLSDKWILRNTTINEYVVCRHGLGQRKGLVEHESLRMDDTLYLDDVLLMRICWTCLGGADTDSEYLALLVDRGLAIASTSCIWTTS